MTVNQELKDYLDRRFGQEDQVLHAIRTQTVAEGCPDIQVSIYSGRLLYLLAKIQNAKQILEIGTLGGYSTAWLAKALPAGGRLISLEINPDYVTKAQKHLHHFTQIKIDIRLGHAVDSLARLVEAKEGPFDLIFIDADKENNVLYLDWALELSRFGTLILIDNLIPKGEKVGYAGHPDAQTIYDFNDYLAQHPQLEIAAIPVLAGPQARLDSLAIARVTKNP